MPDLLQIIDKNVPEVFLTMAGLKAAPGSGDEHPRRPSTLSGVTGAVSLSGKASGIVYTGFPQRLADARSSLPALRHRKL